MSAGPFVMGAAALLLCGCAAIDRRPTADEPAAIVWASCPPLAAPTRTDPDALRLRLAEVEARYSQCRQAVFGRVR